MFLLNPGGPPGYDRGMESIRMNSFLGRVVGAARLQPDVYRQILADPAATRQALAVVVLASFCVWLGISDQVPPEAVLIVIPLFVVIWYFLGWFTRWIGTRLFPEPEMAVPDQKALLRVLGFANAPGILRLVTYPFQSIAPLVYGGVIFWILWATILSIQIAFGYKKIWRAVAVCLLGWLAQILIMLALSLLGG